MRRAILIAVLALAGAWLWSLAGDGEPTEYNVNFYYPSHEVRYLGKASSVSQCQDMAASYAAVKDVEPMWYYDCCMIAHGSDCYEKHK